jgi:prepilin peptidase CpaA
MNIFWLIFAFATVWLAALAYCDCKWRRLPNELTLPGLVIFPVLWFFISGVPGVLSSLLGLLIGGLFLLVPYLLRGAGAGDVKMLASVGALSAYPGIFMTLVITSAFGLILGVVMIVAGKTDGARVIHYLRCCFDWNYDRVTGAAHLPDKKREKVRIPYGLAIAVGMWGNLAFTAFQLLNK